MKKKKRTSSIAAVLLVALILALLGGAILLLSSAKSLMAPNESPPPIADAKDADENDGELRFDKNLNAYVADGDLGPNAGLSTAVGGGASPGALLPIAKYPEGRNFVYNWIGVNRMIEDNPWYGEILNYLPGNRRITTTTASEMAKAMDDAEARNVSTLRIDILGGLNISDEGARAQIAETFPELEEWGILKDITILRVPTDYKVWNTTYSTKLGKAIEFIDQRQQVRLAIIPIVVSSNSEITLDLSASEVLFADCRNKVRYVAPPTVRVNQLPPQQQVVVVQQPVVQQQQQQQQQQQVVVTEIIVEEVIEEVIEEVVKVVENPPTWTTRFRAKTSSEPIPTGDGYQGQQNNSGNPPEVSQPAVIAPIIPIVIPGTSYSTGSTNGNGMTHVAPGASEDNAIRREVLTVQPGANPPVPPNPPSASNPDPPANQGGSGSEDDI